MDKQRPREVEVIIDGQPSYPELIKILVESQKYAFAEYGLGALAVYKVQNGNTP